MDDTHTTSCIHRWILGEPTMNTVSGVCRKCGAHRRYPSTLQLYEATPDYAELDRSKVVRSLELASSGERAAA